MEKFELEFLKLGCVLDHSRRVFVKEQLSTVKNLVNGELARQNRFRRLLLGCKGVGKTTLLTSLLEVTKALYPGLLTLYVSYAATKIRLAELVCCELRKCCSLPNISDYLKHFKKETQSIILSKDLDIYDLLLNDQEYFCKLGITSGEARRLVVEANQPPIFERLSQFLEHEDKRLFLVVDEFQDVYNEEFKEVGCSTIRDMRAIGDNASGRIHCIISGSSTHLRQLAYATLPEQFSSEYPNYHGVDLNSTKYQACWIYPFLDVDLFKSLYKRLMKFDNSYEFTEEETATLYDLFNKTGGSPGYLFESVKGRNVSAYHHLSAKSVVFNPPDERAKVLLAIYKSLPRVADTSNSLAIAASTTFLIPTHISQELLSQAEDILYDMSDAGLIRYITSDSGMKMIGFGGPLVFYATVIQGRQTIAAYEAAALCSPWGQVMAPLAENVACRLLAHAFQKINNLDHPVTYSSMPLNLCKEGVEAPVAFAHYMMYKELVNGKDTFGADSTVLVPSNEEGKNIAYRIQLKLGFSNIMTDSEKKKATGKKCHDTAESISNKFTNPLDSAVDAYERSKIPLSSCIHFLATTRDITPDARSHLDSQNIRILDKKYLYEQVWPPEVQELGPPALFQILDYLCMSSCMHE